MTYVQVMNQSRVASNTDFCCLKTAVCIGDQLLEFSVPELVRSQSTFSTDTEVLQNCTGFTLCSSAGCNNEFDNMHVVCTYQLCVACIGLLSADFSTLNTGPDRHMFGNHCIC